MPNQPTKTLSMPDFIPYFNIEVSLLSSIARLGRDAKLHSLKKILQYSIILFGFFKQRIEAGDSIAQQEQKEALTSNLDKD